MSNISEHLKAFIASIPDKPGIYQMKDIEGNIIYIGKSKTLNKRVKSYFYTDHKFEKINRMLFYLHDIDFITTDTHLEAQILECVLIKKLKPIYNAQFKNHKKYNYLKVEGFNRYKPLTMINERKGENCFGPYRNKRLLSDIVGFFQNIYPIKKCEDKYEFEYKVLPQPMKKDNFEDNKKSLIEILSNRESMLKFINQLEIKMETAASELDFKMASIYRDMINYFKYLYKYNAKEDSHVIHEKILLGERIDKGYKLFYIVNGRMILKQKFGKIVKEDIKRFLKQGKKLEEITSKIINEKRDLDFKQIINAEIKDKSGKAVLYIEKDYDLDGFLEEINFSIRNNKDGY